MIRSEQLMSASDSGELKFLWACLAEKRYREFSKITDRRFLSSFFLGGGQQIMNLLIVDLKEGNLNIDLHLSKSIDKIYSDIITS